MNFIGIKNLDELIKTAYTDLPISDEMIQFFVNRTKKHIDLVRKYCKRIYDYDPERFEGIIERGEAHDESKLTNPEIEPYIWITWDYKYKNDGKKLHIPDSLKKKMNDASEHHINNNSHHPEYHSTGRGKINRESRDEVPEEMIDATNMDDLSIGEMIADWCAMSEEKNTKGPKDWADKNVNKRWKFNPDQTKLIYELIDEIWR